MNISENIIDKNDDVNSSADAGTQRDFVASGTALIGEERQLRWPFRNHIALPLY
jgi:hypothetical protein